MAPHSTKRNASKEGEMTLQEAIERLVEYTNGDSFPKGLLFPNVGSECDREAIATILNAVVKGELVNREVHSARKAILNRYAMRNGYNSQMPDESREDFNLRVHGLSEDDFE